MDLCELQAHSCPPARRPTPLAGGTAALLSHNTNEDRVPRMKAQERQQLMAILEARFRKHSSRHPGVEWIDVQAKLEASPDKLRALQELERTGGGPDVIGQDRKSGEHVFCDCAAESPDGRRSICYDREALESRKEHKP